MVKISGLVKPVHIEHSTLKLLAEDGLTDADVMRALLQAWRNMPHQVHFEHLGISAAEAQTLHANAKYYEALDQVSRVIWYYARWVTREEYEAQIPKLDGSRHRHINLIKLIDTAGESHYAVQKPKDLGKAQAFAAAHILKNEALGRRDDFFEYQVTFKDAAIFDFLRVGMFWRFHTLGDLCPSCLCVESQVELEAQRDCVTRANDPYGLTGETMIDTSTYQCSVCEAKWELTEYSWHKEFIY